MTSSPPHAPTRGGSWGRTSSATAPRLRAMTIVAFGADHAGYELKQHLIEKLSAAGYDIIDHGTFSTESVDYPEFCAAAARSVRDGDAQVGIVVGGSGQGEQLAANKVKGVRAALC